MDAGRGSSHLNGETGPSSPFCPWENDSAYRPWHSTPVRKSHQGAASDASQLSVASKSEMERMARQPSKSPQASYLHNVQDSQTRAGEMEFATIQRQRKELQLLIAELKDRDQELNTMATSHQKQLQAWEQDRQRVLTLEQRATRLDDELHKRNELIRLLTKRVQMVETRERETSEALSATKQWLHEAEQKHQHASQTYQDLEAKNQSLNSTVMALSTQVGSLQVREEELRSMLQLKDKDVSEVTAHIVDVTERLRELETSQKESRAREDQLSKDLVESRRRYRQARHENERLKEELQLQVTQGSAQREEIIRLKQEGQLLRRDLALTGEGESWKDELLGLSRSKQERMDSELHSLRQVCENQQNELQLLQLNLETAREALKQKKDQGSLGSHGDLTCGCLDSPSSSHKMRSPRLGNDVMSLPTGSQRSAVSSNLGVFSPASMNGDHMSSACCLQRMLDESRRFVASLEHTAMTCSTPPRRGERRRVSLDISEANGTRGSPYSPTSESSPRRQASPTHTDSETLTKTHLLHRSCVPDGR